VAVVVATAGVAEERGVLFVVVVVVLVGGRHGWIWERDLE
jgi:hypothetical protein